MSDTCNHSSTISGPVSQVSRVLETCDSGSGPDPALCPVPTSRVADVPAPRNNYALWDDPGAVLQARLVAQGPAGPPVRAWGTYADPGYAGGSPPGRWRATHVDYLDLVHEGGEARVWSGRTGDLMLVFQARGRWADGTPRWEAYWPRSSWLRMAGSQLRAWYGERMERGLARSRVILGDGSGWRPSQDMPEVDVDGCPLPGSIPVGCLLWLVLPASLLLCLVRLLSGV